MACWQFEIAIVEGEQVPGVVFLKCISDTLEVLSNFCEVVKSVCVENNCEMLTSISSSKLGV